jgi:hypothetical protein
MTQPTANQPSPSPDSKKALLQAFDEVLKTQAEARAEHQATSARASGRPAVIVLVGIFTLLFVGAYLWLEQPSWFFPPPPPPESTAVKEASLRIALANAARHVEHFRRTTGRLPATLEETGTPMNGVTYESHDDGYALHGVNGPVQLTLKSSDSIPLFVGNSFVIIARRTR